MNSIKAHLIQDSCPKTKKNTKMFSPEEQQVAICLLKSNLEEIKDDMVVQRLGLPALDAENEQRYRETMTALQVARSLNSEIECLRLDNVRLTAKRMQFMRESDDNGKRMESIRGTRDELAMVIQQEEQEIERQICNYEDTLEEIANRFRQTSGYYNEDQMNGEIEKVNTTVAELEEELGTRQCVVDELKRQFDGLKPEVPDDLLIIIGQTELDEKVNELTNKHESVTEKINLLLNNKENRKTVQKTLKKY